MHNFGVWKRAVALNESAKGLLADLPGSTIHINADQPRLLKRERPQHAPTGAVLFVPLRKLCGIIRGQRQIVIERGLAFGADLGVIDD